MSSDEVVHGRGWQIAWWILALAAFALTVAIRIRILGIPLERDEGEYAYAGQLILQGIPPYKLAFNMKFPGTYAAYALIMSIFGQTIGGIHLGLLLVNAITVVLLFLIGRALVNSRLGLVAAASYAVLSVSPSVLGFAAHATHFVVLLVFGGAFLLLHPSKGQFLARYSIAGVLFGFSLLLKQPAIFFILFGAIYLFWHNFRGGATWRRTLLHNILFNCGAIVPFAFTCLLLWRANVFPNFWFWTINYARQYSGLISLSAGIRIFTQTIPRVIGSGWPLWALAGAGLILCAGVKRMRPYAGFLIGLLAASLVALSWGFYFRLHYFILALPVLSLLAGVTMKELSDLLAYKRTVIRLIPYLLFTAAVSWPIFAERSFFFHLPPSRAGRMIYTEAPFAESIRIGQYIREHTSQDDTIAVLGSEPQIYFYANRHSATGYIYTYALMEPQPYAHQMQTDMIRQIELARPKYVVSVAMNDSWLQRPVSERLIFDWANKYLTANYTGVGLVNILAPDRTDYYWGEIPYALPVLGQYILIYERKA